MQLSSIRRNVYIIRYNEFWNWSEISEDGTVARLFGYWNSTRAIANLLQMQSDNKKCNFFKARNIHSF